MPVAASCTMPSPRARARSSASMPPRPTRPESPRRRHSRSKRKAAEDANHPPEAKPPAVPRPPSRLLALDLHTGQILWENHDCVFGSWLSYSQEFDILLQAYRKSRDMPFEPGDRMAALNGRTGDGALGQEDHLHRALHAARGDDHHPGERLQPQDRAATDARAPVDEGADPLEVLAQLRLRHGHRQPEPADLPVRGGRLL